MEIHGYDDAPWPMWYILYATLLLLRRVWHYVYSLMRTGNAIQHCQGLCVSVGAVIVIRNGNSMQNVYGGFVNVLICCYVFLMSCGGLNKSILQVRRMRNGNTLQKVYGDYINSFAGMYSLLVSCVEPIRKRFKLRLKGGLHKPGMGVQDGNKFRCPHGLTGRGKGMSHWDTRACCSSPCSLLTLSLPLILSILSVNLR